MVDIILINPRFEFSFWGLEHALPFIGKRAALPVPLLVPVNPAEPASVVTTPAGVTLRIVLFASSAT